MPHFFSAAGFFFLSLTLHKIIGSFNESLSLQLRLDFITFNIAGPSTATNSVGKMIAGQLSTDSGNGMPAGLQSSCLTDLFSISNPGGPSPPKICGYNADTHSKNLTEICIHRLLPKA